MAVREAWRLQRQSSTIAMHGAIGSHAADAIAEHAAAYEAIRDGDPEAAAEATGVLGQDACGLSPGDTTAPFSADRRLPKTSATGSRGR